MRQKKTLVIFFIEAVASLLVVLFIYTSIIKLRNSEEFVAAMHRNPLISNFAFPLSWLVPSTELIIAGLLIIPKTRRYGLLASTLLMTVFTFYVAYMLFKGGDLPCTCGGIIQKMSWQDHLLFNMSISIFGFTAWLTYPKRLVATTGEAEHL